MRKIIPYNNPILHNKAEPVKNINGNIRQLIDEMTLIMKKAEGVGIAAPQVGESLQLAIVDMPRDMGGAGRIILINPKITSAYGNDVAVEGCLSVPGVQVKVKRYKEVTLETMNLDSKPMTYNCTGFVARAVQHEIDHLNGVLIIDKMSPVRRLFLKRKISKTAKEER